MNSRDSISGNNKWNRDTTGAENFPRFSSQIVNGNNEFQQFGDNFYNHYNFEYPRQYSLPEQKKKSKNKENEIKNKPPRSLSHSPHRLSNGRFARSFSKPNDSPSRQSSRSTDLNIWKLSKQLFKPIAAQDRIEKVFRAQELIENPFYNLMGSISQSIKAENKEVNWKTILTAIQQKTEQLKPNLSQETSLITPETYILKENSLKAADPRFNSFQKEKFYKGKENLLMRLLSSFVTLKPDKTETKNQETQSTDIVPHYLMPKIEIHSYLRFTFEERLEFELQSIGLDNTKTDNKNFNHYDENAVTLDLINKEKELQKIDDSLNEIKEELINGLPEFRRIQKEHIHKIDKYKAIIREKNDDDADFSFK